jgi:peptide/nickel transport system permease protein
MMRYVATRVGLAGVTIWGLATIVFVMVKLIPGDEAQVAAGQYASADQVEAVRRSLGLDASLPVQYIDYLDRLLHGNLGSSTSSSRPVLDALWDVLPPTVELVILAGLIDVLVAVPLGVLSALRRGSRIDGLVRVAAVTVGGVPTFVLALIAQYVIATKLHVLPVSGELSLAYDVPRVTGFVTLDALLAGDVGAWWNAVEHLILPAAVLALPFTGMLVRITRSSMIEVLDAEYLMVAKAKGIPHRRLVFRHGLANALNPILSTAGIQLGVMLGSAVLVESVFGRSGLGGFLTESVSQKDTNAVLGAVLFIGVVVVAVNLVVDLLQMAIDPRVRSQQMGGAG